MSELARPDDADPGDGRGKNLARESEKDPETWYGLVWRIVQSGIESNAYLIRLSILIVLVCGAGAIWLIASTWR